MLPGASDVVVVTGGTGLVGRHLVPVLRERYESKIVPLSSKDFDLVREQEVVAMFERHRPTLLVNLAGYVGGVAANRSYPAEFFYRNVMMTTVVLHHAWRAGVRKVVTAMCGCSYPANAASPIREASMWEGLPQADSAPYAVAKKLALVQSAAYRQQYGFKSIVVVPGNMYGAYDNFDPTDSHVVPAIVRRVYEAHATRAPEVVMWGSGRPVRDFVYAGDVARLFPYFIEEYDSTEPVNLSSGIPCTIRELAETVCELVGYRGSIVWDTSRPEGQLIKVFDVSRMKGLGLKCETSLRDGLRRTLNWFEENYAVGAVRL